jgi:outer membrane immunogenic protein
MPHHPRKGIFLKKLILLAGLASGSTSTAASAQEPPASFTGPRAELRIGAETTTAGVSIVDGAESAYGEDDQEGITFAGEVGYDLPAGAKFVGGVYAGLDFSSVARCQGVFGNDEACLEADRTITLGGRAGFQPSRNLLLYLKGGYSRTRLTLTYETGASGFDPFEEDEDVEGFHVGTGLELRLGGGAYTRLEYVYTAYADGRIDLDDTQIATDMNRQQVLLGFGYRF